MANALTKKAGPLPVWAWGILGGIAVYFLYTRYSSSSTNSAANSPVATALDPNQVDPTTGLTYGQELAGSYPAAGSLQAGASGGSTSSGGVPAFDTGMQDLIGTLGDFGTLASQLGYTPPNPSTTTADAAASAPLDNSQPVATNGNAAPAAVTVVINAGKKIAGKGKAIQTKNPAAHRAKTVHVANPAPHQHQVTKPKSTAAPQPVKHPAGGGNPGKVQSGSHAKPTTAPSQAGHPVARNPAPHPAAPPPPRRPAPPPKPTKRRGP